MHSLGATCLISTLLLADIFTPLNPIPLDALRNRSKGFTLSVGHLFGCYYKAIKTILVHSIAHNIFYCIFLHVF